MILPINKTQNFPSFSIETTGLCTSLEGLNNSLA